MATSLEELGRWNEAAAIWENCILWIEFTYGYHHESVRNILSKLVNARLNGARYEKALKYGRRFLIEEIHYAHDNHLEIFYALGFLGRVHTHLGQYEEALLLLNAALEGKEQHLDHDHWIVVTAIYEIAQAYWLQKDYDRSFDWVLRSVEARADEYQQCAAEVKEFAGVIDKGLTRDVEELRILCQRYSRPKVSSK